LRFFGGGQEPGKPSPCSDASPSLAGILGFGLLLFVFAADFTTSTRNNSRALRLVAAVLVPSLSPVLRINPLAGGGAFLAAWLS
jgi:hypothetical protein